MSSTIELGLFWALPLGMTRARRAKSGLLGWNAAFVFEALWKKAIDQS